MHGKVGAFWVLPELRVVGEACSLAQAEDIDGNFNGPMGHDALWPVVAPPENRSQFYGTVQRGRVVYRGRESLFVIFAAQEIIESQKAREVVEKFFGLHSDGFKKQWCLDPHYKTQPDLIDEDDLDYFS